MRKDQEAALLRDLKRLTLNQPRSLDILNWTAQISLNQKDWDYLKNLGIKNKVTIWQYVAEKNLNSRTAKTDDTCFALMSMKEIESSHLKACNDPLFLDFIDWTRADLRGLSKRSEEHTSELQSH